MAPVSEIFLAQVDLARGDLDRAAARLQQPPDLRKVGPIITRLHCEVLAELHLWRGNPDQAQATVRAGLEHLRQLGQAMFAGRLLVHGMRACADSAERARAAHADALLEKAVDAASELDRWASGGQPNPLSPEVTHVVTTAADQATWAAEQRRLHGRSDPRLWEAAAAAWRDLERPVPAAYALWRAGETLLSDPNAAASVAGAAALRAAAQAAEAAGAALIQRQVEALARRTRLPLHPPTPAAGSETLVPPPPCGLTPRELEILRQLAQGYTNRQIATLLFLSPKTVGVHVERIFRKLDVHDRVTAATKAHRLGLVD
jgi:ATP/maltotriose-dependent transcriptional regulator MalT